jgi:hypothetical protein
VYSIQFLSISILDVISHPLNILPMPSFIIRLCFIFINIYDWFSWFNYCIYLLFVGMFEISAKRQRKTANIKVDSRIAMISKSFLFSIINYKKRKRMHWSEMKSIMYNVLFRVTARHVLVDWEKTREIYWIEYRGKKICWVSRRH